MILYVQQTQLFHLELYTQSSDTELSLQNDSSDNSESNDENDNENTSSSGNDTDTDNNDKNGNKKVWRFKALNPLHQLFVEALYYVCYHPILLICNSVKQFWAAISIILDEHIKKIGKYKLNKHGAKRGFTTSSQNTILVEVNKRIDEVTDFWSKLFQQHWACDNDETQAKNSFKRFQQEKCRDHIAKMQQTTGVKRRRKNT